MKMPKKDNLVLYTDNKGKLKLGKMLMVDDDRYCPGGQMAGWLYLAVVHSDGSTEKIVVTNTTFIVTVEGIKNLYEQSKLLSKKIHKTPHPSTQEHRATEP
jgi:hypothetical protein